MFRKCSESIMMPMSQRQTSKVASKINLMYSKITENNKRKTLKSQQKTENRNNLPGTTEHR